MSDAPLPNGWRWANLGDLAADSPNAITDGPFGSNLKSEHYTPSGPRVIRLQNIGEGVFVDEYAHISNEHFARLRKHEVVTGDLVVAILGERLPRACRIPPGVAPAIVKADCVKVSLHPRIADGRYVNCWLNSAGVQRRTTAMLKGVGRPRINLSKLRQIPVAVPPLPEQRRIVAKIEELSSDLDAGVAALQRVRANLKRYRAAVLKAAVEGRLTEEWRKQHPATEPAAKLLERILAERRAKWEQDQLRKFKEAGKTPPKGWKEKYVGPRTPEVDSLHELPQGWMWTTLDMIAENCGGITKGQKHSTAVQLCDVPYLRVANVQRGYLDLSEIKTIPATKRDVEDLRLLPGDILFNEGGDRDKLGRGWVWNGEIPECIHQNHVFRARLFLSDVQPKFVSHHGNSFGQLWFLRTGKQSVNLASINLTVLRNFPVPLPPAAEQSEIVAEVDRRLSVTDAAEQQVEHALQRAARLRQAILKRAFEGKLVPQDPADEPATALLERISSGRAAEPRNGTGKSRRKPPSAELVGAAATSGERKGRKRG